MADNIAAVTCVAGEWTVIASNAATVCFQWRSDGASGRWAFGASAPEVDTDVYWTLRARTPQSLNELAEGTVVWAMPNGGTDLVMEVVSS